MAFLAVPALVGGLAAGGKLDNVFKSDVLGDIASVTQFIDPIFSPAFLAIQEGYTEEQTLKKQARATEAQARFDAAQARKQSLFQSGQEYLYFTRAGVYSGAGSPLDLLTQNSLEREKEALAIELKGWNEGQQLRTKGVNARRAAITTGVKNALLPVQNILSQVGLAQSPYARQSPTALQNTGSGASAFAGEGGVSYAGATAGGIDAAAGGAAALNGTGSGLAALALA